MLRRFQLAYQNEQMETEYTSLQQNTNVENIQLSFYFLVLLLLVPGIPALIEHNYLDAGIAMITGSSLFFIYFCKSIPRKYVQFLSAIVICSFNNCIFFLETTSLDSLPKSMIFLRGYASGSINVALLSRFTSIKQKILFLVYAFAFRITLMVYLNNADVDTYSIIRSLYIDLFVAYANFVNEKRDRSIFKWFFEYREELTKFKELLSDYFPQSITVFSNFLDKPFFSNRAFTNLFGHIEERIDSPNNSQDIHLGDNLVTSQTSKLDLRFLRVDRSTIREVGSVPSDLKFSGQPVYLQDIVGQLVEKKLLDQKPLSVSAFHPFNNESKSFEVILTKIKWDGKDAIVVILNDTTYQEKLISLKIADSQKDQIIATVSHELRTPLNGIIGILGMAEKRVNDRKVMECLGLCKDNAHLLLGLVNSILDLNQVRQGKLRLNPTKLKVKQVLSDVIRLFVFQCKNKGIYLNLSISSQVCSYINTDENRLKQILINLIGNALKFTLKGGITVDVGQDPADPDFLLISVSDTGIGIKDEDKDKLFKMYEKLDHGRSVNHNGVGLGLTISNTLACLLSGRKDERTIEVTSSVDQGSKFSFKILKDLNKVLSENVQGKQKETLEYLENSDADLVGSLEEFHEPKEVKVKSTNLLGSPSKMQQYNFSKHESSQLLAVPKKNSTDHLIMTTLTGLSFKNDLSPSVGSRRDNLDLSSHRNHYEKGCILVVDDNMFNLLVAENIVKDLGYSFKAARSGPEAIEILKTKGKEPNAFKAILMDCQMPLMDGFEAARILTKMMDQGEVQEIPIIALTASNGDEDIKQCYESGMVDHLSKPLFNHTLFKALAKFG